MTIRMRDDLLELFQETVQAVTKHTGREPVMEVVPAYTRTAKGKAVRTAAVWFVMAEQGPKNHGFRITTYSPSQIELNAWGKGQTIAAKLNGYPSKEHVKDILWAILPPAIQPTMFAEMDEPE